MTVFSGKMKKIQQYLCGVKDKVKENNDNQEQFKENYDKTYQLIVSMFKAIRALIDSEEQQLLSTIEDHFRYPQRLYEFSLNNQKFEDKNTLLSTKLTQIEHVLTQVQADCELSQLAFLQKVQQRQATFQQLKFNTYDTVKTGNFAQTKNSVVESVIKAMGSLKTTATSHKSNGSCMNNNGNSNAQNNNFNSNPTPGARNYHNQAPNKNNNFNNVQPLRGFRKAAFSNINSQNLKPQNSKKVSTKKQSISHHVQQSNTSNNNRNPQRQKLVPTQRQKQKALKPTNTNNNPKCGVSNEKKGIKKIDIIQNVTDWSVVNPRQSLCDSFMSNMTSFLSQRKSIYVLGGFNQGDNTNIIKMNMNTMTWQQITSLSFSRSKFGSVFVDKLIYLFGGKRGKERLNDVQTFNVQTQKWSKMPSMSKSKSGFGITYTQNEGLIYLIGGNDGDNILSTVETFNIKTKEWSRLPSMNDCRDELSVVVGSCGRIYAIGGFGGKDNQPLSSVQVYSPQQKKWKYISPMKLARRALSSAFLADGIYAIGGFDGDSYMSSVERYDEQKGQWSQITSMNVPRCTHSSVAIFETQEILVFGGFDFSPLNSVQKFSMISNQWENLCDMPVSRFMHSSVIVRE